MLINEVRFIEEEEEDEEELEVLRMEHFYFPLILWLGGMVLSTVSFMAEIIIKALSEEEGLNVEIILNLSFSIELELAVGARQGGGVTDFSPIVSEGHWDRSVPQYRPDRASTVLTVETI